MKTFQDLLQDLRASEALLREAAAAFDSADFAAIVAFGKAHGYEFTEEDIHFQRAADRPMDDAEMELVSGGVCMDLSRCMYNSVCKDNAYAECYGDDYCSDNAGGHCGFSTNGSLCFGDDRDYCFRNAERYRT